MKLSSAFIALSLLLSPSYAAVASLADVVKNSTPANIVPGRYVVEMSDISGLGGKRSYIASPHKELYETLRRRAIAFEVKNEFDEKDIWVGATLQLKSEDDAARVAQLPQVKSIRPVILIPSPQKIDSYIPTGPSDPRLPVDKLSTHVMTGVDKVHAQGINGKGIKIGIIDTGVDYNHPALGGGLGQGFKVIAGYDFVGDNYNGANDPLPDDDPDDNCNGHGTHVAGIIGANPDNDYNINGVAYGAQLGAYRMFGCKGSATDDIIIQALLRGYKDGMDVLSLSLGGVAGWTEAAAAVVASRIADSGRVVTIAAGNDGGMGGWYASAPGTGKSVISVGSVDNIVIPIQNATVSGVSHNPIPYLQATPFPFPEPMPIYATSTDTAVPADACSPLPASTPDLSGYIVIVRRGTCSFTQKLDNIKAKGGKVTLIYNTATIFAPISVGTYNAALISAEDGAFLVNQFAAKAPIKLQFPKTGAQYNIPAGHGGFSSQFSTFGPTYDAYFKPAISAPGGNILSTVPLALGGFGVQSGTSMSTPFLAGVAGLVLQAKGKSAETAKNLRTLLQTTASTIPSDSGDTAPAQTLTQAGAGLVQVAKALSYTTTVAPGQLTLNDTANFNSLQGIAIRNGGKTWKTYKISHTPAGTALTIAAGSAEAQAFPVPQTADAATVDILPKSISIPPGVTLPVVLRFTAPKGTDPARLPVYSGFIDVTSDGETLHVPYMGIAASLKDKSILDTTDKYFDVKLPALLDAAGDVASNASSFTLAGGDAPSVLFRLAFGSPSIRLDLVDRNTTFTPTIQRRAPWSWWWGNKGNTGPDTFKAVPIAGTLAEYDYVPRNTMTTTNGYNSFELESTFVNGTKIVPGEYRVLVRALRVAGNPRKQEDYESWLSPEFTVKST